MKPTKTTALAALLSGSTVTAAAEAGGVSRETVHKWMREDFEFQAELERGKRELMQSSQMRLFKVVEDAVDSVHKAIQEGDSRAALAILKGLGMLNGTLPELQSDNPDVLRQLEEIRDLEDQESLDQRHRLAGTGLPLFG